MKKFCERCGKPLLRNGKCAECDADKKAPKKKSKVWIPIVICISVVAVAAAAVAIVLSMGHGGEPTANDKAGNSGGTKTPTVDLSTPYEAETLDAEEFLGSNGEIQSKLSATDSDQVQSESELMSDFSDRGFGELGITTAYDMSGVYLGNQGISYYSNEQHPIYSTYYVAENGETWVITSVNGVIMAEPYGYNYLTGDGTGIPVIVTETDVIYSYDGTTNQFFRYVPDSAKVKMVKVSSVDSETLDSMTPSQLGG